MAIKFEEPYKNHNNMQKSGIRNATLVVTNTIEKTIKKMFDIDMTKVPVQTLLGSKTGDDF